MKHRITFTAEGKVLVVGGVDRRDIGPALTRISEHLDAHPDLPRPVITVEPDLPPGGYVAARDNHALAFPDPGEHGLAQFLSEGR